MKVLDATGVVYIWGRIKELVGIPVKNLAGSASPYSTVIKGGNDNSNPSRVYIQQNAITMDGRAGGVVINNDGVSIQAGNSGYPNAAVKVNGSKVVTESTIDGGYYAS